MRLLVIDHGRADPPDGRVFRCRAMFAAEGIEVLGCGPARVSSLEGPTPGLCGIPLVAVAAGNRALAAAVKGGDPEAFLVATAKIPPALLGLVRETARQAIAEAVDGFDPDAILVLHAGIFADLAVETGLPVAVHASAADLAAAGRVATGRAAAGGGRAAELVAAALASADVVVPADGAAAVALAADWLEGRPTADDLAGPVDEACGPRLAAAVRLARRRRGGA